MNYMEDGTRKEPAPLNAFHKAPNSVIGADKTMVLPDGPAAIFEGEVELAVVIGKRAKAAPAAEAMNHVFGYVNFIDGSARCLPPPGNVFFQMKSRATFAPIGPSSCPPTKSPTRITCRFVCGSMASSSRISTPRIWRTRSPPASSE